MKLPKMDINDIEKCWYPPFSDIESLQKLLINKAIGIDYSNHKYYGDIFYAVIFESKNGEKYWHHVSSRMLDNVFKDDEKVT